MIITIILYIYIVKYVYIYTDMYLYMCFIIIPLAHVGRLPQEAPSQ